MKLATLCYLKKDGKTLMLHRIKKENDMHKDKYNGLGGKIEVGETPEECIIREVKEESGLTITNPKLHGYITFPAFANFETWNVFLFTATTFTGELIDSEEGNLEWISDDKILDLPIWEGDKLFFTWMQDGRFFSGKLVYDDNGRLKDHSVVFY